MTRLRRATRRRPRLRAIIHGLFFAVSKALAFVTHPLCWAWALLVLAVILRRRLALAAALAACAVLVVGVFSAPSVADWLQRRVEASASSTLRLDGPYDAAIIPAGSPPRVFAAAELVRTGRARFLLYSGALDEDGRERLADDLLKLGVPEDRTIIEAGSRNTRENAVESARTAAAHRWRSLVIVTSAAHAERALGAYRKAGLEPDVLVVDRLPPLDGEPDGPSWPSRFALDRTSQAMHEIIGRLVYRAVGYGT